MSAQIQANAIVTVELDGDSTGRWDVKSGGEITADIPRYRPGGSLHEELLNGLPTGSSVSLDRGYDRTRDHRLLTRLEGKVGNGDLVIVWQPCDGNMVPTADDPIRKPAKLSGAPAIGPDYDSNGNEVTRIAITAEIAG